MRHHVRVSAYVPSYHRHLDRTTNANTYFPPLHRSFTNRRIVARVRWHDGGAVGLVLAYDADLQAEQGHHLAWVNATIEAAQQAGLQIAEAYVTRSVSMALLGGGAGAAGGYKAGGAGGAILVGAVGLLIGHFFRTHVPIFRAVYSPYYGWQLEPVQQFDPRGLRLELA